MGKFLKTTGRILAEHKYRYIASTCDCGPCPLKCKCCPNIPARMIPRDINEDARDVARALAGTQAFEQSRRDRKRVEMLFAHLKHIFRLPAETAWSTRRIRRVHARGDRPKPL